MTAPVASRVVTVTNPSGIHARPAAELARLATEVDSTVRIAVGDRTVGAGSVLSLMSLGITQGQRIEVTCEGETAIADLDAIAAAINGGLGEIH